MSAVKIKQIQPYFFAEASVHPAVDYADDQFAGGADNRPVQMTAHHAAVFSPGAHVQVAVKFVLHGIDRARERHNLITAVKMVRFVFLFGCFENAHRKAVHGAQTADRRQLDFFFQSDFANGRQNLLAGIESG